VSACQSVTNVETSQVNDAMDVSMQDVADEMSIKRELSFDAPDDTKPSVNDVSMTTVDIDEPTLTSPKSSPKSPEIKGDENEILKSFDEKSREIADTVASQKVENQDFGFEKVDDQSKPEVAPIPKPEMAEKSSSENEKIDSEIESKIRAVRAKAAILLAQWVNLQEVFKIPKKEMLALRTKHEAEVDQAAAAASEVSTPRSEIPKVRPVTKPTPSQSSYERGKISVQ